MLCARTQTHLHACTNATTLHGEMMSQHHPEEGSLRLAAVVPLSCRSENKLLMHHQRSSSLCSWPPNIPPSSPDFGNIYPKERVSLRSSTIRQIHCTTSPGFLLRVPYACRSAQQHSSDMAADNYFSHTGSDGSGLEDRAANNNFYTFPLGENIAAGFVSIQSVVIAWMW